VLVACAPDAADAVLDAFRGEGFTSASVIGHFEAGAPAVTVA
jgi:selenide,water dikinase